MGKQCSRFSLVAHIKRRWQNDLDEPDSVWLCLCVCYLCWCVAGCACVCSRYTPFTWGYDWGPNDGVESKLNDRAALPNNVCIISNGHFSNQTAFGLYNGWLSMCVWAAIEAKPKLVYLQEAWWQISCACNGKFQFVTPNDTKHTREPCRLCHTVY